MECVFNLVQFLIPIPLAFAYVPVWVWKPKYTVTYLITSTFSVNAQVGSLSSGMAKFNEHSLAEEISRI